MNRIATSRYALPLTLIYGIVIWLLGGVMQQNLWIQMGLMFITTLAMVELNNQHALMRTYSRMHSCSYLVLSLCALPLFVNIQISIVQLCVVLFYLYLFQAYQDKTAINSVFNAFFFIGLASVWFVKILYIVPFVWIALRFYIVAMGARTFSASFLGMITPYWFVCGYYIYQQNFNAFIEHFHQLVVFQPIFHFSTITDIQMLTFCFVSVLGILGMIHFLMESYKEKIRIRLLFSTFIFMTFVIMAFIILQPNSYPFLLPVLIVSVSPLIGHYITFTNTRISHITCLLLIVIVLTITGFQLWMQ